MDGRRFAGDDSLQVPAGRLLQDWQGACERAAVYAQALGFAETEAAELAREAVGRALSRDAWDPAHGAMEETLRGVREAVQERHPFAGAAGAPDGFPAWRLAAARSGWAGGTGTPAPPLPAPVKDEGLTSMPRLRRGRMVPERIERRVLRRLLGRHRPGEGRAARRKRPLYGGQLRQLRRDLPWTRVARRRRLLLVVLVLIPSVIASGFMVNVLPDQGRTWLELAIVLFFGALFGWISIGFWTALLGFFTLVRRRDRFAITRTDGDRLPSLSRTTRTAIVMPICEEPVDRVFAGLQAIYRSVERAGARDHFHFFILSDTSDPSTALKEEEAWFEWCKAVDGFDRIFYRRRKVRLRRKSGNVADFCRRWGKQYPYMIMLDADSVMTGETLVRVVQLMDRYPDVGMIQTVPTAVNRRSLFARVQQFASRVYGPMFAAGLHFWQLGDGQYWGHNAIIRVSAFMDHCGLPRLPGKPPLGGEILSHDFVEAALMGRAGWTLWLAYDLPGSFEEVPSTLLEEMKRDRRWCQGNLQHLRLLFTEGLFGAHRALFLNGALSYMSALLWFSFLSLSTAEAIKEVLREHDYFPHGQSLFPDWPIWRPDWALWLVAVIGLILFLPKVLSIVLIVARRRAGAGFGGAGALSLSVFLEILLSSLLAPIRMVFHSRFVLTNLLGRTVTWRSQGREDAATGWGEAIRHHGLDTLVASAWGACLFWLNPDYFWWVTPIVGALILSVPVSVLTSRVSVGDRARAWGLFMIPEESAELPELRDVREGLAAARRAATRLPERERDGFVRAAVDPFVNAIHRALLRGRRSLAPRIRASRRALLDRALAEGPASLGARDRRMLLGDPDMTDALHRRVWELADRDRAARWGRPAGAPRAGGAEVRPECRDAPVRAAPS